MLLLTNAILLAVSLTQCMGLIKSLVALDIFLSCADKSSKRLCAKLFVKSVGFGLGCLNCRGQRLELRS